jgi:ribosomal protein L40E
MLDNADSYCERCGTRYEFHATASKTLSLKGARVLATGLKNFVLNDNQSLNDAMALAREADQHENTTRMTEAFHRTFNFCMTCRQYACDKCWNPHQGACLTCAPEPGLGPVEPEDHLIVRTPVARGHNDWALFPDILRSESEPAAEPPAPLSGWPSQDLHISAPEGGSRGTGAKGRDPLVRQSEDREAWNVWPLSDEIAPEMTLTPGEMAIIEAQLAQDEPAEGATAADEAAPPAAPSDLPETKARVLPGAPPPSPAQPAEEPAAPVFAEMAPPPAEEPAAPVFAEMAPPPSPASAEEPAAPVFAEMAPPPAEEPAAPVFAEMAPPPSAAPADVQPSAITRLLGRFSLRGDSSIRSPEPVTEPTEPATEPWPRATEWSQRPIQAHDWFTEAVPLPPEPEITQVDGGYTAATVAPLPPEPEIAQVDEVYVAATVAPLPPEPEITQVDEGYAAATGAPLPPEPEIVPATQAAAPSDEVPSLPEPPAEVGRRIDFAEPLSVAAMPPPPPMPFDEQAVPIPAGQQTLFDVAPATDDLAVEPELAAARPEAHPEAPEVVPEPAPPLGTPSPAVPLEAPPLYRSPQAPAPWPPIGARWPARETPGAPWPGPEAPSVPAAVVAREAALPVLAGMWAQSAQEVLSRGSVRVCHRCALPVSTQARYCRRCGTKQA